MIQAYSDPARSQDSYSLPDLEIFRVTQLECNYNLANLDHADEFTITEPGWYYWFCFPGCVPDSEAIGPFESQREAIADARGLQS